MFCTVIYIRCFRTSWVLVLTLRKDFLRRAQSGLEAARHALESMSLSSPRFANEISKVDLGGLPTQPRVLASNKIEVASQRREPRKRSPWSYG